MLGAVSSAPEHPGFRGRGSQASWVALALGLLACATPRAAPPSALDEPATEDAPAAPWPQGSALFHGDGRWVGADSAYSIDLGHGRVLWLFADTFVDPAADGSRTNGPNFFLRNSLALQHPRPGASDDSGYDATQAELSFAWGRADDGTPRSFFADGESASAWVWPLHGARLPDGRLLLFRMRVQAQTGGLGFGLAGWDAIAIDEPQLDPARWKPRSVAGPTTTHGVLLGSSVLVDGGYLYAYAVQNDDREHALYLARFALAALAGLRAGALDDPEWFTGPGGFVKQSAQARPAALFTDGQVELSVHHDAGLQRFVSVQMQGLLLADPKTVLAYRTAPRPEGPWSSLRPLLRPSEAQRPDVAQLVAYAGKAHPEQRAPHKLAAAGRTQLVLSYVAHDLASPLPPDALYYPQLVTVELR